MKEMNPTGKKIEMNKPREEKKMNFIVTALKEFDKKFVQFNEFGTPIGGFEQAPYDRIKQFLTQKLNEQAEEIKQLLDDEGYVGKDDIIWHELPIISEMNKNLAEELTVSPPLRGKRKYGRRKNTQIYDRQ